jgi:hypothetical protein
MPIRTMVCTCPAGYVTDENGGCRTLPPIVSGCERDDECNDQTACINAVCRDPCGCGLNARCDIVEHRPVCICEPGFYGKLISLILLCPVFLSLWIPKMVNWYLDALN